MKRIVFTLLTLPAVAFAAIPQKTDPNRAQEILQMPPENQKSLIENQPDYVYRDFVRMAFDENLGMRIRWKALMAAALMKKVDATNDLVKASKNQQWFIRNAAMIALAEYNPETSESIAKNLLKDKALVVRSSAVEVLAKNPSPRIRDILWEELHKDYNFKNKKSLWIRPQILEALVKNPRDEDTTILSKLLNEKEIKMQILAVHGLEKLTGMKLGQGNTPPDKLVKLWQSYYKNN